MERTPFIQAIYFYALGADMKPCFFIGHRDTPDTVLPVLRHEVERHIVEHVVNI